MCYNHCLSIVTSVKRDRATHLKLQNVSLIGECQRQQTQGYILTNSQLRHDVLHTKFSALTSGRLEY